MRTAKMKMFCFSLAMFCALVGVGVLEDCEGHCIPEDANAAWRWIVAGVSVCGTAFFGLWAATIPDRNDY